jgi:predicted HTH domain antitoxin
MQIAVEIPDSLLEATDWTPESIQAEMRKELAVTFYRAGSISEGKAAEVAGMNRFAFSKLLGERHVERNYRLDDLQHDMEWAKSYTETRSAATSAAPSKP